MWNDTVNVLNKQIYRFSHFITDEKDVQQQLKRVYYPLVVVLQSRDKELSIMELVYGLRIPLWPKQCVQGLHGEAHKGKAKEPISPYLHE